MLFLFFKKNDNYLIKNHLFRKINFLKVKNLKNLAYIPT